MICTVDNVPKGWLLYYKTASGYRVNYTLRQAFNSIFASNHNEVWIIWSDIFPFMYFVYEFYHHLQQDMLYIKYGLLFGIMTSKLCSIIYHVFNCVSLTMNQTLLYVDLIGIANMAFGSPYMYAKIMCVHYYNDNMFLIFCITLFSMYVITVGIYAYFLYKQIPYYKTKMLSQTLIVILGAIGNLPVFFIREYDNAFVYANISILSSYFLFYLCALPERLLAYGATDGKLWNSHVFWHIGVFLSQYWYLHT